MNTRNVVRALVVALLCATPAWADGTRSHAFTSVANDSSVKLIGSGISYNKVTWNKSGTVTVCAGKLQKSVDNAVWTDYITVADCSVNGASLVDNSVVNYVRMITTSFTGSGTVTMRWDGYVNNPSGGGGTPGGADTNIQFNDMTTFGGQSDFTFTKGSTFMKLGANLTLPAAIDIGIVQTNTDGILVQKATANNHFASSVIGQATVTGRSSVGMYMTGIGLGSEGNGTGAQIEGYEGPGMAESVTQNGAGVFAAHGNYGVGTVQSSAAFRGLSTNLSTGTITNSMAFWGQPSSNPGMGTITNAYNFYAEGNTAGALNYSYYSAAGKSRMVSPNAHAASEANDGMFTVVGDGYGDIDGLGSKGQLVLEGNNDAAPFSLVYKNADASTYATTYFGCYLTTSGNHVCYGSNDNMTFSGYTVNPSTDQFLFDDGGGGATYPVAPRYDTLANCSDSAGDAACGSASAGAVVIDAADTTTVVSTTAVTADSEIRIQEDSSLGARLGVTCNATIARIYVVTARTAGASFTITSSAAPAVNPACLTFMVIN